MREADLAVDRKVQVKLSADGAITADDCSLGTRKSVFLGHFLSIWGHCITDNLRKFWFLQSPECQRLKENGYTLVCTLQNKTGQLPSSFIELISYFGLKESDVEIIHQDTTFQELIVPQDSLDEEHHYHREFKETIDYLISRIPKKEPGDEKIYLSRAHLRHNWRDYGENMIEDAFRRLGYVIIYPETLTFVQQIQLYQSCGSFAATDGSIAHNAMFCRDGIECIVVSKKVGVTAYQYSIMNMKNFKSIFIDAHLSIFRIFATWFGPFFMYANDNLVRFCGDRGVTIQWSFPLFLYVKYTLCCLFLFVRYRLPLSYVSESGYYHEVLMRNIKRKLSIS